MYPFVHDQIYVHKDVFEELNQTLLKEDGVVLNTNMYTWIIFTTYDQVMDGKSLENMDKLSFPRRILEEVEFSLDCFFQWSDSQVCSKFLVCKSLNII